MTKLVTGSSNGFARCLFFFNCESANILKHRHQSTLDCPFRIFFFDNCINVDIQSPEEQEKQEKWEKQAKQEKQQEICGKSRRRVISGWFPLNSRQEASLYLPELLLIMTHSQKVVLSINILLAPSGALIAIPTYY